MGDVARFPAFNSNHSYSDAELRVVACEEYCNLAGGNHLDRIARKVGKPVEVVRQWHQEDNWALKRSTSRSQRDDGKLAELAAILDKAGVDDSRTDALDTLQLLRDAKAIVRSYLKQPPERYYPEALDRILSAVERIDKLSKSAYARL